MASIETIRHSYAHILAAAIQELFPKTQLGVGPAIDSGFYHDFASSHSFSPEDLPKIEKKMKEIIKQDLPFKKISKPIEEALKEAQKQKLTYRAELIQDLKKEGAKTVSFYQTGNFINLCKGPHVKSTKELDPKAFKLTRLAGAYWKGDEKNKMLQRVYGAAFKSNEELCQYLKQTKEAEEKNHRKLGRELELFAVFPELGQGLPVWLPKGYAIRRTLEDYMLDLEKAYGYVHILTPHINKKELFEKSGHLQFYKESMYSPMEIDKETFYLKPMNCPAAMLVYKMKPKSYRDLPLKMGEFGAVYRYEKSGEIHGLQRVRGFTQNDAHIFCAPEQLESQFMEVFEILKKFYRDVGFDKYFFRLSLADFKKEKYIGKEKDWQKAEETLRKVLKKNKIDFQEAKGEAAFYGPKLDVQAVNIFGKEDTISTIQVDFNLPQKFNLSYINKEGKEEAPFVIHRALIGSFERFFAFLIEHHGGAFPVWLAPVQAQVIPLSKKFNQYALKTAGIIKKEGIRTAINDSDETLGKKIREGEKQKIPYLLIVGQKEESSNAVSVRNREKGDLGKEKTKEWIKKVKKEIEEKK